MATTWIRLEPSNVQPAWCDQCNLSCAATYDVVTVDEQGVQTMGHGVYCPECDPDTEG